MPDFEGTVNMNYNPCVLLVFSNCMSVIDAKLTVSKGYKGTKYPDTFYIHHEYDDNDDVSKLSAFCKASFICDQINCMTNNNLKELIFNIVHEEIRKLTDGRYGEVAVKHSNVNTEQREHEYHEMNASHPVQMLLEKTIKMTCKILGMLINKQLASFSFRRSVISTTIPYEIYAKMLFEAMKLHVIFEFEVKFGFNEPAVYEGFERKRKIVEDNLFQLIRENAHDIVRTFIKLYNITMADLTNVCLTLKKLKKRCRPRNMSECKYILVCLMLLCDMMLVMYAFPLLLSYS